MFWVLGNRTGSGLACSPVDLPDLYWGERETRNMRNSLFGGKESPLKLVTQHRANCHTAELVLHGISNLIETSSFPVLNEQKLELSKQVSGRLIFQVRSLAVRRWL
jgi:hypothetical protein